MGSYLNLFIFPMILSLSLTTITITILLIDGMSDSGIVTTEYSLMMILVTYQVWMVVIHSISFLDKILDKNKSEKKTSNPRRTEELAEPVTFVRLHSEIAPPPYEVAVKL